jgi:hypothetical protein
MTASPDGTDPDFVPADFEVPGSLTRQEFTLVPLTAELNDEDYRSWTSSMDHIHRTPGFEDRPWPHPMSVEENRQDLLHHERDFAERRGFTYSVVRDGSVIGCVYIYPAEAPAAARVRSWVDAEHADLDVVLYRHVRDWLREGWPFRDVEYAARQ